MKPFLTLIAIVGVVNCCVAQKVSLQLNLEQGATYSQQSTSEITVKQNYAGQEIEMTMKVGGRM
jgi:hypothetical protein